MSLQRISLYVLLCVGIGSFAGGCASDGDDDGGSRSSDSSSGTRIGDRDDLRLPRGAQPVGRGNSDGVLQYRPTAPGTIHIVDATADYVLHSQRVQMGQMFVFEPSQGRARIGKGTVFARDLPAGHDYRLYFVRDPSN